MRTHRERRQHNESYVVKKWESLQKNNEAKQKGAQQKAFRHNFFEKFI